MTLPQAHQWTELTGYSIFDATKLWPEADFPAIDVGYFMLDANPKNYFAEIEQLGFAPSTLIPGIIPSPDPILQTRLFIYPDTQCYVCCFHSSSTLLADQTVLLNYFSALVSTCSNCLQIDPYAP